MLTRTLSGAAYAALFLGLAWVGGPAWAAFVALLAVVGTGEGLAMTRLAGLAPAAGIVRAGGAALPVAAYLGGSEALGACGLAIVAAAGLDQLHRPAEGRGLGAWLATSGLPLAIAWPLAHLVRLRELGGGPAGLAWLVALLVLIWVSDSAAYLAGRLGRRPLAPSISPKKTWEGFGAGLAATAALGAALPALLAGLPGAPGLPGLGPAGGLLLGLAVGLAGPAGDLVESSLKRQVGIKDSGSVIPGHGGVLDRVDSLLIAAPLTFYIALVAMDGWGAAR